LIITKQKVLEYESINIITRYPNFDPLINYTFGQVVFSGHYYYKNVLNSNLGKNPPDYPTEWLQWDISNRYAQIDLRATTRTTWDATSALEPTDNALITEFKNNAYDIISFGAIVGGSLTVELFDALDQLVWSDTAEIYNRPNSNSWYGYYFDIFTENTEQNFMFRLPPVTDGTVKVTLTMSGDGEASVAYMIAGNSIFVGNSLYGAQLGLDDNSVVQIDDFGIKHITKRDASEFMDINVSFPSSQINQMKKNTRSIFGDIVLFIGDEAVGSQYSHLQILGYVESYTSVLSDQYLTQGAYSIKEII